MYFDLLFKGNDVRTVNRKDKKTGQRVISDKTVEEEFYNFFYSNNLIALFTNEHRANPITVSLTQAQSILKAGNADGSGQGQAYKIFKDFSNYLLTAQDNKAYEQAIFKIIYESRTWQGLLKSLQQHMQYIDGIKDGYQHNTWNIVFYDKDKSGTKVSGGI